jgi:octopine/nopaline transport system permease protein
VIAIALNSAAYIGDVLRGAISGVPQAQVEAAAALGLSRWQRLRRVVLPLALRRALPALGNEGVQLVQGTALASAIALMELTGAARALASQTFRPVEAFTLAGMIYLAMTLAGTRAVRWLERRFALTGDPAGRRSW